MLTALAVSGKKLSPLSVSAGDESMSQTRVDMANIQDADFSLSLHMNSYEDDSISGFETWANNGVNQSVCASSKIAQKLDSLNYTQNRGQKFTYESPLQVIDTNKTPAVLVEMGFITSTSDLSFFASEQGKGKIATSLAMAVVEHRKER